MSQEKILGCILNDNTLINELKINPDWFHPKYKLVFESMREMYDKYQAIDKKELTMKFIKSGINVLSFGDYSHEGLFEKYQKDIENEYKTNQLRKMSHELIEYSGRNDRDSVDMVSLMEKTLTELQVTGNSDYRKLGEYCHEVTEEIERAYHAKSDISGIPSGFGDLDRLTAGFQPQNLIIVGARPSVGKSAFVSTIVQNLSVRRGFHTGVFSLEMGAKEYLRRIIAGTANIPQSRLKNGALNTAAFSSLTDAMGKIYEAPIYIDDTAGISLFDLKNRARRMKRKDKIQILFIDYIGLITNGNRKIPRHEQMAEVSKELKGLSMELDIPVVALSQVGRQSEGKMPNLADLRETGAIEQDADVVIFLHRTEDEEMLCAVAKQRNGPIGTIGLTFRKEIVRFEGKITNKQ